jgi:DNA-binding NarL/FixJ family response regulator
MVLLDGNDYAEAGLGVAGIRGGPEPQRVMLIMSNTGSVSPRLVDAVEREFPWILVEQVGSVAAACRTFSHPVALMLVDVGLMGEAEAATAALNRMHSHALAAVIEPYEKQQAASLSAIVDSPLFRSVLPMDMRLDIWLSIIRLMLCGGEYFPPGSMVQARPADVGLPILAYNAPAQPAPRKPENGVSDLTARELQILEMVSRGLQNKLIAAAFGLSEHTVKIHLHNIIRKLGVHNRTEAAARFRNARHSNALFE